MKIVIETIPYKKQRMKIVIKTIPHKKQRLRSCGDWQFSKDFTKLNIKVSDTGNPFLNFLIGRHEMDEAILCLHRGVPEKLVDAHDTVNTKGNSDDFSSSLKYPTARSHNDALASEWQFAQLLGIDWLTYGDALELVGWGRKRPQKAR